MGTWGYGPFENDVAADFVDGLDDARPEDRKTMVRSALLAAADSEAPLSSDTAIVATAAAAVVATRADGNVSPEFPCAPEFLDEPDTLAVDTEIVTLAAAGSDRALDQRSHLARVWQASGRIEEFRAATELIRSALRRVRDDCVR